MGLESQIEGVLFYRSEPMTIGELTKVTKSEDALVEAALDVLTHSLQGRGIALVRTGDTVELMTAQHIAPLIEEMRKEELKRDIGKAGAETLAIVAYHGAISRAEIDFIRGVNSTFILRNLMIRGLVLRAPHPTDQRSFVYKPTLELYAHLGITRKEELPQYAEMMEEIAKYKHTEKEKEVETT